MEIIISLIIPFFALIVAITIHEFSHAAVADFLGDPTPRSNGRLSLNPLRHLDPLGTIMLLLVHFGWGKPVPIDPYNLSHPRRDEMLISFAGPASNILLAICLAIIVHFLPQDFISYVLAMIIQLNVVLAVFNLLPIPPLDGSKIFLNLLPENSSIQWEEAFDRYGTILLIILLFLPVRGSNIVNLIIFPIISKILGVLL